MPHLKLSADEVLTTTRAVRKRLDRALVAVEAALAPESEEAR